MTGATAPSARELRTIPDADLDALLAGDFDGGLDDLVLDVRAALASIRPHRPMDPLEWVSKVHLPRRVSPSRPGPMRLDGWQREPFLAMVSHLEGVKRVVMPKSARLGYNLLFLLAVLYVIDQRGEQVVVVRTTEKEVADLWRTWIEPILTAPRNRELFARSARHVAKGEAEDTMYDRFFGNGGILRLRWAGSEDTYRGYSAGMRVADEVTSDAWKEKAAANGDPLERLEQRGQDQWRSMDVIGSTPLTDEELLEREWQASDKRYWHVRCLNPECGVLQRLERPNRRIDHGFDWTLDADGRVVDVVYRCEACGHEHRDADRAALDASGEWVPSAVATRPGTAGYRPWSGISLNPKAGWIDLIAQYLRTLDDPAKARQYQNEVLGLAWSENVGRVPKPEELRKRLEAYKAPVPGWVLLLVAGLDVQRGSDDQTRSDAMRPRVEIQIVGVGAGGRMAVVDYVVVEAPPEGLMSPAHQATIDAVLEREWPDEDGVLRPLTAGCMDAGEDSTTMDVRDYCALRSRKPGPALWAIKGDGRKGAPSNANASIWPATASANKGRAVWMIEVPRARIQAWDAIFDRRRLAIPTSVSAEYLTDLIAKRRKRAKGGKLVWTADGSAGRGSGEAFDTLVYAIAAVEALRTMWPDNPTVAALTTAVEGAPVEEPHLGKDMSAFATERDPVVDSALHETRVPAPPKTPGAPRKRRRRLVIGAAI